MRAVGHLAVICLYVTITASEDVLDHMSCDTKSCSAFRIQMSELHDLHDEINNSDCGVNSLVSPTTANVDVEVDMGGVDHSLELNVSQVTHGEVDAAQANFSDGVWNADVGTPSQAFWEEESDELEVADPAGVLCTSDSCSFNPLTIGSLEQAPAPVHQNPWNGEVSSDVPSVFSCTSEICSFNPFQEGAAEVAPAEAEAISSSSTYQQQSDVSLGFSCTSDMCSFDPIQEGAVIFEQEPADAGAAPSAPLHQPQWNVEALSDVSSGLSCTAEVCSFDPFVEADPSLAQEPTLLHQHPWNSESPSDVSSGLSCTSESCSLSPFPAGAATLELTSADAGATPSSSRAEALLHSLRNVRRHGVSIVKSEHEASPDGTALPQKTPPMSTACVEHPACNGLGLSGECCPTADGVFLQCCADFSFEALFN